MDNEFTGYDHKEWKRVIYQETGIPTTGVHHFEMAQPGNRWGIDERYINLLEEPERTMCLRVRQGKWPQTRAMLEAMPPRLQRIMIRMAEIWRDSIQAKKDGVPQAKSEWQRRREQATLASAILHGEPGRGNETLKILSEEFGALAVVEEE